MKRINTPLFLLFSALCGVSSVYGLTIVEDTVPTGTDGYVASELTQSSSRLYHQNPAATTGFSAYWGGLNTNAFYAKTANVAIEGVENDGGSIALLSGGAGIIKNKQRPMSAYSVSTDTLWFGVAISANQSYLDSLVNSATAVASFNTDFLVNSTVWGNTGTGYSGQTFGGFGLGIVGGKIAVVYQSDALGSGNVVTQTIGDKILADTGYFIVASLAVSSTGADTLSVWALTSAPSSAGDLGAADIVITMADVLGNVNSLTYLNISDSGVTAIGAGATDPTVLLDAIRLGTDYVSIIPEPAAAASFLGLACIGLVTVRFRRR